MSYQFLLPVNPNVPIPLGIIIVFAGSIFIGFWYSTTPFESGNWTAALLSNVNAFNVWPVDVLSISKPTKSAMYTLISKFLAMSCSNLLPLSPGSLLVSRTVASEWVSKRILYGLISSCRFTNSLRVFIGTI